MNQCDNKPCGRHIVYCMNACLMLTLSLAALIFLWWEQDGAQKIERQTVSPEATRLILWQHIGKLPSLAKWLELLLCVLGG